VTVSTFYDVAAGGFIQSTDAVYATSRAGAALTVDAAGSQAQVGQWHNGAAYFNWEAFIGWDTSAIPDTDVVSAATLDIYVSTDGSTAAEFVYEVFASAWGGALDVGDWVPGANLAALTRIAYLDTAASGGTGAKTFTSEAGFPAAVSKTGITYVMIASSRMRTNNAPAASGSEFGFFYVNEITPGSIFVPKLTVTHAAGPPPPPAAVRPSMMI